MQRAQAAKPPSFSGLAGSLSDTSRVSKTPSPRHTKRTHRASKNPAGSLPKKTQWPLKNHHQQKSNPNKSPSTIPPKKIAPFKWPQKHHHICWIQRGRWPPGPVRWSRDAICVFHVVGWAEKKQLRLVGAKLISFWKMFCQVWNLLWIAMNWKFEKNTSKISKVIIP